MVGMGFRRIALAQGLLNSGLALSPTLALDAPQMDHADDADSPPRNPAGGRAGPDRPCTNSTDNGGMRLPC